KLRFVVRMTNRYIISQIVEYNPDGDKVLISVNSKELIKYGWKFSCKNTPAAYLTGFLCGIKFKNKFPERENSMILDIGLRRSTRGGRIYAVLKGALDSNLDIPHSDEILPDESRIKGEHISKEVVENFNNLLIQLKNLQIGIGEKTNKGG
ncbi:MAG: 50S ribosomal protein L18, partial [Candidatus Altarchaeaceae archaeon]